MKKFIQIHLLTSYGPANLNRDDLGRPKTATVGGALRLRVSSQSLKRAWRTSDLFAEALSGFQGIRTKEMGIKIYEALTSGRKLSTVLAGGQDKAGTPLPAKKARELAKAMAGVFGALKKEDEKKPMIDLEIEQLAHFGPGELQAIDGLLTEIFAGKTDIAEEDKALLRKDQKCADISMFGRMIAADPSFGFDAAVQVSHAFSVQKIAVEEDYFTAVDDLNRKEEDAGAGHIGVNEFAAGLFYLYICVDTELLRANLQGDAGLAVKSLRALGEAAATVGPIGKQASYASRAKASYILAEKGDDQPRSLAVAFLKPVYGDDMLPHAIENLENTAKNFNQAYEDKLESRVMNVPTGQGTLKEILDFITE